MPKPDPIVAAFLDGDAPRIGVPKKLEAIFDQHPGLREAVIDAYATKRWSRRFISTQIKKATGIPVAESTVGKWLTDEGIERA